MPVRFTEDGDNLSPPIAWTGTPANTKSMVLIAEDADSPTPHPLVHALAWNLPANAGQLAEASLKSEGSEGSGIAQGKNSFFCTQYLPPDPPPGHGEHRYAFQLFALDDALQLENASGRSALLDAMVGHVVAKGCLIGTYERL